MDKSQPKFRIAICGGGISGLCLAVALAKHTDIAVQVYEAAERFKEIGAGVMIWSRTWRILELLGLAADFSKIAHAPPDGSKGVGFDYRKSDQPEEGYRFHIAEMPYGCIRFHRAQFLDVFVNHLPEGVAHFGKRLVSYAHSVSSASTPVISLEFADNSSAECDVLIGCDGVKSMVRRVLFESLASKTSDDRRVELLSYIEPIWSGTIAYRGLVKATSLPNNPDGTPHRATLRPMMYCGKSKHVVAYSIAQGEIINVITFRSNADEAGIPFGGPWVTDCAPEELLDCYAKWEPEVEKLLTLIDKPTKWALHHLKPLPQYVEGRIALVGDAAHAMLPHQGAGAGQAIEDSYLLSQLLASTLTNRETLPLALRAYEHVRRPVANYVLQGSAESGMMYEFDGPQADNFDILGPAIQKQWDWIWWSTPEGDVTKAMEWLATEIGIDHGDGIA